MLEFKEILVCVFFGLCVYFAMLITDYLREKRDKNSEPAQVHLYACAIMAFASAMLTAMFSMVAMMLLGVHNGYWLVAVILTLTAGYMLVKYIFEKILPNVIGEERAITGLLLCFAAADFTCLLGMIFWSISYVTGIAVQYSCFPYKI